MIQLTDIHPLTEFLRNHKEHIARLKKAGRPEVLTINGRAEVVIQDAESYQKLVEAVERAEVVAGIRKGLESMRAGKGRALAEFDKYMREKYNLPPR